MEKSIEELIEEETKKRLNDMESDDYQFPRRATIADAVCIIAGICISLILIILCMTGVLV